MSIPPEIREVIPFGFPRLVLKKMPVSPIEIDVDYLPIEVERFEAGGWEAVMKKITAKWVKDNHYLGRCTVWGWGAYSANFNRRNYSMFYAVLGIPDEFREYLGIEVKKILGEKYVRPYSDYVIPNLREGWDARFHVEDGKTWEYIDIEFMQEVQA